MRIGTLHVGIAFIDIKADLFTGGGGGGIVIVVCETDNSTVTYSAAGGNGGYAGGAGTVKVLDVVTICYR